MVNKESSKNKDCLLNFSERLLEYVHKTATYYEDKKHKFLYLSMAIIGFSVGFLKFGYDNLFFLVGSSWLILTSLIAIIIYVKTTTTTGVFSELKPSVRFASYNINLEKSVKENYAVYRKKFLSLNKNDILEDNISQIVGLFYMYKEKMKVIKRIAVTIVIGVAGFCICSIFGFVF
jgi:hypothetical protein